MSGLTKEHSDYSATRGSRASSYSSSRRDHPYPSSSSRRDHGSDKPERSDRSHGSSSYGGRGGGGDRDRRSGGRTSSFSDRRDGGGRSFNNDRFSKPKFGKKPENEFGIKYGEIGSGLTAVDWSSLTLKPFKRDFYTEIETESSKNRPKSEIDEWKKEHDIECFAGYQESMKGSKDQNNSRPTWNKKFNAYDDDANSSVVSADTNSVTKETKLPKPVMEFNECGFSDIIMKAIKRAGFAKPTPIQCATWPMILSGNNVIGIAQTGSGKTLAFMLPAVVHIMDQTRLKYGDGPVSLIIAPTRELACQIEGEVEKFACNLRHCCVYGGVKKWEQKRKLKEGVEIIIATPGRLLDFLESGVTNLRRVTYACIDEADRLLDMGFEPQLTAILNQVRPDRQILMFSATWPKEVRTLARKFMITKGHENEIMQVAMGSTDSLKANKDVTQLVRMVERHEKIRILKEIIDEQVKKDKDSKILVFISTKKMCNNMQDILWSDGYWVTAMHGDKEQKQRDRALNAFKKGEMKIMLATDVASRGIHVDDIKLVVNFDFPTQIEDYVHRIGRTGRAGTKGLAISMFNKEIDGFRAKDLMKILKEAGQEIPSELEACKHMRGGGKKYGRYGGGRNYRNYGGGGGGGGRRW